MLSCVEQMQTDDMTSICAAGAALEGTPGAPGDTLVPFSCILNLQSWSLLFLVPLLHRRAE